MKLGKNEKKILVFLLQNHSNKAYLHPDGASRNMIAEYVFEGKKIRLKYAECLIKSISASLSASLTNLWKKGLIFKGKPIYKKFWDKEDKFMGRHLVEIYLYGYYNTDEYTFPEMIEIPRWHCLDYGCHIWYILTDKGRNIAKKLKENLSKV